MRRHARKTPTSQLGRKGARKTATAPSERPSPPPWPDSPTHSSQLPGRAARKTNAVEFIVISSDSEEDAEDDAPADLLAVATPYRIAMRLQSRRRMPFLSRSLRRSFAITCQVKGVNTHTADGPRKSLRITYRYRLSNDNPEWLEYQETVSEWSCPLCGFFGIFNTAEMLQYHITLEHTEAKASWSENVCCVLHEDVYVQLTQTRAVRYTSY